MDGRHRSALAAALGLATLSWAAAAPAQSPQAAPRATPQSQSGSGTAGGYGAPGSPALPGGGMGGLGGQEGTGSIDAGGGAAGAGAGAGTGAGAGAGGAPDLSNSAGGGAVPGLSTPSASSGLGGAVSGGNGGYFQMLGDAPNLSRLLAIPNAARPPGVPAPPALPQPGVPGIPPHLAGAAGKTTVAVIPSVRGFKIAENQSPQPQDRIYFSFNYFDNLNQKVNQQLNSPLNQFKAYRYSLGLEKTVLDGRASVGLRMPIDNLSLNSRIAGLGGTSTSVGDLAAIFKYALYSDRDAGRLLSAGLLLNMPTGPRNFAGARGLRSPHNFAFQPFLGYFYTMGSAYFQGFTSIDVPTNPNDVTIFYQDLAIGYYVYRAENLDQFITAIAPTFETHINVPLNHANAYNIKDPAGSYTWVDLTFGANFQIRRRSLFSMAIVEPITGPRPFNLEALAQFNIRF